MKQNEIDSRLDSVTQRALDCELKRVFLTGLIFGLFVGFAFGVLFLRLAMEFDL